MDQALFGAWVDVDRDVFVGSVSEDHYSFVYRRSNGAWAFEGFLPDEYARVHGDRLLTNTFRSSGPQSLRVWKRGPVKWATEAVISPDSPQTGLTCCYPLDIWGNTVAFRARGATGLTAIHVYAREQGSWRKQAELVPSDAQGTGASYVLGLDLWGRSLVALYQASATSGWAAYVWEREAGTWHERARLAPAGDLQTADLQEDTLVLGTGPSTGGVFVYERSADRWIERARLVASDGLPIGRAVALDGRTVVAATHYGVSPGRIYQFRLPSFPRITTYGCGVNPEGSLEVLSGAPAIGTSLRLGLGNPLGTQAPGARAYLALASRPDERAPCGTLVSGLGMNGGPGERLVRVGRILEVRPVGTWNGQPLAVDVAIPQDPSLVGHAFYLQGVLHDPRASATVRFGLTEAIELEIGRP